jgi:hypothetical protein
VKDREREVGIPPLLTEDGVTGLPRLVRTLEWVLFMGINGTFFFESNMACKLETLDFSGVSIIAPPYDSFASVSF